VAGWGQTVSQRQNRSGAYPARSSDVATNVALAGLVLIDREHVEYIVDPHDRREGVLFSVRSQCSCPPSLLG